MRKQTITLIKNIPTGVKKNIMMKLKFPINYFVEREGKQITDND